MHLADDPKVDAISAGITLRRTGPKRILSRLDVQILTGIGQSSAIKLMKSTHHCFRIANQYFVMEEDLIAYFRTLAEEANE